MRIFTAATKFRISHHPLPPSQCLRSMAGLPPRGHSLVWVPRNLPLFFLHLIQEQSLFNLRCRQKGHCNSHCQVSLLQNRNLGRSPESQERANPRTAGWGQAAVLSASWLGAWVPQVRPSLFHSFSCVASQSPGSHPRHAGPHSCVSVAMCSVPKLNMSLVSSQGRGSSQETQFSSLSLNCSWWRNPWRKNLSGILCHCSSWDPE